jgi:hypothetical protein
MLQKQVYIFCWHSGSKIGPPMTLKEPEATDNSTIAEFIRECGDTAARAAPTKRYPKRARPAQPVQFEMFPSPHESAAAQRYLERRATPDAKSQLTFKEDDKSKSIKIVSSDHENDNVAARLVVMDTFATGYYEFSEAMLDQLRAVAIDRYGQFDAQKLAQITAMIQGINPQNELEAMMAVQMATVHVASMKAGEATLTAHCREHQQWAGNSLAKLGRTFAMQVDTLKNLRLNGSQHIHIYHHQTTDSPGGASKIVSQSHGPKVGNQTRQSSKGAALRRQIKAIAKGLPRPRDARS